VLITMLVVTGTRIALVQTPRPPRDRSPRGPTAPACLYNLVRFTGSAVGGGRGLRWRSMSTYPAVFAASAVIVALGLAGSFVGPDPQPI